MSKTHLARTLAACLLLAGSSVGWVVDAHAHADDSMYQEFQQTHPELFPGVPTMGRPAARPAALPDIFGPGSVLTVGNCYMKITNYGLLGNPFTNLSTDPSEQWPGASGVEYLSYSLIAVGGKNPQATDPNAVRRVSYFSEWRPPSLDPEDRIYRAYDGIINGQRLVNDDNDRDPFTLLPRIDEDFLDGRDNDGDKLIDEDYAALGQLMFSCVIRDDTPAAINTVYNEKHVPLGLEIQQLAWAYSIPGFQNFNPIEFTIFNRSGHTIDSMYFGLRTDIDCGPIVQSAYWADDFDAPYFPQANIPSPVLPITNPQRQVHIEAGKRDTLCPITTVRVTGFTIMDDDGDQGKTPGVSSVFLLGMTTDPLGLLAPKKCQLRAFRSYINGTPYSSGGNPTVDQERYEFMSGTDNVDQNTGDITMQGGDQKGDYATWFSIGPWLQVPDGGSFQVTVAFGVDFGTRAQILKYPADRQRYEAGSLTTADFFSRYPQLENAYSAQVAYNGVYETPHPGFEDQVPNCHGCETRLILPKGTPPKNINESCPGRESVGKIVNDHDYTWFDFDCDYCTGVWDEFTGQGYFLRHWNAESPPPNPNLNVASIYNYSANPDRTGNNAPAGDHQISLAWDNLSETTPDPKTNQFDFRSYRVWKAAGWTRPVGSSGPADNDWALLNEFRWFNGAPHNYTWQKVGTDSVKVCPNVWIPQRGDSMAICLDSGDLWDRQSGMIIKPDPTVDCVRKNGQCIVDSAFALGTNGTIERRVRYPIGRYRLVDREVQNGFTYFYSIAAGDSSPNGTELFGRRSSSETDGVVPQASTRTGKNVWVVPNPYRGYTDISKRPSAWDLTPNATDPTGTSIAFMGMPPGKWTLKIYTVAGDLVQTLHNDDPVNDSIRPTILGSDGKSHPGYNAQQDNPNDGQARWNLISRNGQDIVSGIYVFVVESGQGTQRGKFVVIR